MAKDPQIILRILSGNNGTVDNLYRYLYIPQFYQIAYRSLYSKDANERVLQRVDTIIGSLRDRSYRPNTVPSFEDKLLQEVVRMILSALYEHTFRESAYGLRDGKSCHMALDYVRKKFTGTKWWIDIDISGCLDHLDRQMLISILAERIKEQKFLNLIDKFVRVGCLDNWRYNALSGAPTNGNIMAPILANIYLDKLDRHMHSLCEQFHRGKHRKQQAGYTRLAIRVNSTAKRIARGINIDTNKARLRQQVIERDRYVRENGYYEHQDPNFRRMQYVRHTDRFAIGVIASKQETLDMMHEIVDFLEGMKIHPKKYNVMHNSKPLRFLGYDLVVMRSEARRTVNGIIGLYLPFDAITKWVIDNHFGRWFRDIDTGKPRLKATHLSSAINLDELRILYIFNTKMRQFYEHYQIANNVYKLARFAFVVQTSFLRTLAAKYRTTCKALYKNPNYSKREMCKTIVGITRNGRFHRFFGVDYRRASGRIQDIDS